MNLINTPPIGIRTAAPTAATSETSQGPSIAAVNFTHHHVLGDGDCLFRAMHMGLTHQPGVEPSENQVMSLRQYLANYVYQHQDTLAANPAFDGRQGVLNLYDLLLTPGHWDDNVGDLVVPLLAQVSGRSVVVLQAAQEGTAYHVRQVFSAENAALPPGLAPSGEASICLAHIDGKHYGYLEERYPNVLVNALDQYQSARQPNQQTSQQSRASVVEERGVDHRYDTRPAYSKRILSQLSPAQKNEMAQLWLANPRWGERKIATEFTDRNPGLFLSKRLVHILKLQHPALKGLDIGSKMKQKKLDDDQKERVVQLWLKNPKWSCQKMLGEFNNLNSEKKVSLRSLQSLKMTHPSLGDPNHGFKHRRQNFNEDKNLDVVRLWQKNPLWGDKKIATEFKKRNPGLNISLERIRGLRMTHPDLRAVNPGSQRREKKLRDEQVDQLLQLWFANPRWGERRVANEFMKQNPGSTITRGVIRSMKNQYPDLFSAGLGSNMQMKTLSDTQEREALRLWQANPSWNEVKFAQEYMARNPGINISQGLIYNLKCRHPDLPQRIKRHTGAEKKLNSTQEQALIALCQENLDRRDMSVAKEFNKRNPEVTISHNMVYRLRKKFPDLLNKPIAQRAMSAESMVGPEGLSNRSTEQDILQEDTLSHGTFASLSEIIALDDISIDQSIQSDNSDNGSLGTFDGLDDLEDLSSLTGYI